MSTNNSPILEKTIFELFQARETLIGTLNEYNKAHDRVREIEAKATEEEKTKIGVENRVFEVMLENVISHAGLTASLERDGKFLIGEWSYTKRFIHSSPEHGEARNFGYKGGEPTASLVAEKLPLENNGLTSFVHHLPMTEQHAFFFISKLRVLLSGGYFTPARFMEELEVTFQDPVMKSCYEVFTSHMAQSSFEFKCLSSVAGRDASAPDGHGRSDYEVTEWGQRFFAQKRR